MPENIVSTGFHAIDTRFPVYPGSLIVVASRPAIGKTSMLRTIYESTRNRIKCEIGKRRIPFINLERGRSLLEGDKICYDLDQIQEKIEMYDSPAFVDYAQLIEASGIEEIASRMKQIAGTRKTIFLASQLNRTADQRPGCKPTVEDIDDSLYQACDQLWLLSKDAPSLLTVKIAKNRHGETGTVEFFFDPSKSREVKSLAMSDETTTT